MDADLTDTLIERCVTKRFQEDPPANDDLLCVGVSRRSVSTTGC
jgi:hypothetical protein